MDRIEKQLKEEWRMMKKIGDEYTERATDAKEMLVLYQRQNGK